MLYPEAAWERSMTVQEGMLKALSGELHWFYAAETLGGRRERCAAGASGTRCTAIAAWWRSGCTGRRSTGCRRARSRTCSGCTVIGMRDSMCGTFMSTRGGRTA